MIWSCIGDGAFAVFVVWALAIIVHLFWECVYISWHGFASLPPCGHWWCQQTWGMWIHKKVSGSRG